MACATSEIFGDEWPKVCPLPKWWRLRDRLTPGSVWHHYNLEYIPGSRRWLERWMKKYIETLESIADVVWLGNSLRYFSPELFWRMQPHIHYNVLLLYHQGRRVCYPSRSMAIMLPALLEMGIWEFVFSHWTTRGAGNSAGPFALLR
jgi:hypothetical protein